MPGHDYAQGGVYFLTLCVEGRACRLGEVVRGSMRANDAGRMVQATWYEVVSRCASIDSEAFQLMPNHVHGLVEIAGHVDSASSTSLAAFVRRFKTMTTRLYGEMARDRPWPAPRPHLWQRNYYEHIVRNDRSRDRIVRYIAANPSRWAFDRENPDSTRPTDL
jgi:REP-associated tyrosine transposase